MATSTPPRHLRPATKRWFEQVCAEYELEEHHRKLLTAASEAWDRLQQAREALEEHGLVYVDARGIPHPRPEVSIERDSRIAFARILRELRLDTGPPEAGAHRSVLDRRDDARPARARAV